MARSFSTLTTFPILVVGLAGVGCTATVGPYVADVQQLPSGDLVVVRCTTTVTRVGNTDRYETGNCTKKVLRYPYAASAQPQPAALPSAPARSTGTLVGP